MTAASNVSLNGSEDREHPRDAAHRGGEIHATHTMTRSQATGLELERAWSSPCCGESCQRAVLCMPPRAQDRRQRDDRGGVQPPACCGADANALSPRRCWQIATRLTGPHVDSLGVI